MRYIILFIVLFIGNIIGCFAAEYVREKMRKI